MEESLIKLMNYSMEISLLIRDILIPYFDIDLNIFNKFISIDINNMVNSRDCLLLIYKQQIPIGIITPLGPWDFGVKIKNISDVILAAIHIKLKCILTLKLINTNEDRQVYVIKSFKNNILSSGRPYLCKEDYYSIDLGDLYEKILQNWKKNKLL